MSAEIDLTTEAGRAAYAALGAREKRGRVARPNLPAAGRQERTGLSTFIRLGWSVQSPDAIRYRLYKVNRPDYDTGLCESEKAACEVARQKERAR